MNDLILRDDLLTKAASDIQSADVFNLVRCKDCVYFAEKRYCNMLFRLIVLENDFCSKGRRIYE